MDPERLARFHAAWLEPARLAPPTLQPGPHRVEEGPLTAWLSWVDVAEAPWNEWYGQGLRLFNARAGIFLELRIEGTGELRWLPERSSLEINTYGEPLQPAPHPAPFLAPLMEAALAQERAGLDGDLVARTRSAGAFRQAYLPTAPHPSPLAGLIGVPTSERLVNIAALRLVLAVEHSGQVYELEWIVD